jgi:hypothetical protein
MRYFLDTEFDENGETIEPISLALLRQDERFLYLEFPFDAKRVARNAFVVEHVLPHLNRMDLRTLPPGDKHVSQALCFLGRIGDPCPPLWIHMASVKREILGFIGDDPNPEFWAYYADYDWVLFCRIFGKMVDLPEHFPKLCLDLQQWFIQLGRPQPCRPPQPKDQHNALADAMWNMAFHANLSRVAPLPGASTHPGPSAPSAEESPAG